VSAAQGVTVVRAPDLFNRVEHDERVEQFELARAQDLVPYFRELESEPGPVVRMEGAERVMLGSNNYCSLTEDPRVKRAAHDAVDRYGTGLTGSRFMNGSIPLHSELEHEIAEWMDAEAVVVYTAGYLANVGCLSTLLTPRDTVVADVADHASVLEGVSSSHAKLRPVRHARMDRLEDTLRRATSDGGGVLVVVDGVFSMEGDVCDLERVLELCRTYGARLLVDEAHGLGVLGERGQGACEHFGIERDVDLRMGTFSKTLASCGGFIAGPRAVVDYLRVHSRAFIFTAASVPAALGAALAAVKICRSDEGRELFARVRSNAAYLQRGLEDIGYRVIGPTRLPGREPITSAIVPVVIGDDWDAVRLWRALYDAGVYTNAAVFPAVDRGSALLRSSVMASHERDHLDRALELFERVGRSEGVLG
jgi:8-amino-7-oxononanoate synthase